MEGREPNGSRAGGGSIRVKKLRNKEAKWRFQARLMSRYNVAMQMVGEDIEVVWAELKEGILRSDVEVCGESRVRGRDVELHGGVRKYKKRSG